ncbi:protease [Arthrobacter livingstonensis]|uniref:Protease n=1 Tax=Arthrobacter livingstonensis TaxID=670078 RepID=A0A2V5LBR6_9MICC|nr:S8 family serine peptidase [Arthrobacter livingstonensis]PYI67223.1 protease [Arthrobacter livingstonensis]
MKHLGRALLNSPGFRRAAAISAGLPLLLSTVGALPATASPLPSNASTVQAKNIDPLSYQAGRYIVVLAEKPAATYNGGTAGLTATKPSVGRKLDAKRPEVKKYQAHLESRQAAVAKTENVTIKRKYTAAINGFSANLSADQALQLAKDPDVLMVAPDTENAPDYSTTDYLGLSGSKGSWKTAFGGVKNAGKGVVVGVVDSGYTPSNPFFAGTNVKPLKGEPQVGVPYRTGDGQIAMLKADGDTFTSECQKGVGTGAAFDGTACNSKVLGAHYFADDFLDSVAPEHRAPQELLSPVDVGSHGTHTASTAAGNANIHTNIGAKDMGITSGIAPAAKLSIYKICWEDDDPNTGGCYTSAAVAAINQAILDGVDVLNYSISGSTSTTTDPVALAFLSAASAGVFVAVSAGNSGPTPSTVNHGAPWLTTVAATTFSSELQGTAEFADGSKFRGASMMDHEVPASHVALAADAAAAGAATPELCGPDSLDATKATGKIVVCDRGVFDRVAKSAEVKRAGGIGMILVNVVTGSEDLDLHSVPTVHVNPPDSQQIKDKVKANPDILVALVNKDTTGLPVEPQPQIAGFSSRGPLTATDSDLLKPDVAAPGVNVLAGVSPIGSDGAQFGMMSGTSMASPHVAGFGALILSQHPTWSPATIKSAMMTTATDVVNADGTKNTDVFATGAGQVAVAKVLDPGLVYDANADDYLKFIQGTGLDLGIPGLGSTKARDMNLASFAVGSLAGKVTVTRTVTALSPGMYRATANVPGVDVKVTPSVLNFSRAGEQRTFKVTFENAKAPLGEFATGSLVWQGAGKNVASPIAVRPLPALVARDTAFSSKGGSGTGAIPVVSGSNAPIKVALDGLSKADSSAVSLVPGPLAVATDKSNFVKAVTVPAGSKLAKFSVISSDPTADFDMIVFNPDGSYSDVRTGSSSETLSLSNPAPGTYTLLANLYSSTGGAAIKATVDAAVLGASTGNATVTPNPLKLANGKAGSVALKWTGLETGSYIGRVSFGGTDTETFVSVIVTPAGTAVVPDNGHGNNKVKPKKDKPKKSQQLVLPEAPAHSKLGI